MAKVATLQKIGASPAQLRYADTLYYGTILSFVIMLVTYIMYISGVMTPQIPMEELPHLWNRSAEVYCAAGHIPQGWGWLAMLDKGDICNLTGIAFLALLTIICFMQLSVNLARNKQWLLMIIALLEIVVLSLAASGVLVTGTAAISK